MPEEDRELQVDMARSKEETNTEKIMVEKEENTASQPVDTTSGAASRSFEDKQLEEIEHKIRSFSRANIESYTDYSDWKNLFDEYQGIYEAIDDYVDSIPEYAYSNVKDRIESFVSELNYYNDGYMRKYNSWTAMKGKSIEERSEKQQILNFAVFSLFMTLLTFLLSNIVIITKTDFSVKTIVVINLVLLLVASIVFLFIGLFFGLIKKRSTVGYVFKHIVLSIMPIIIAAALIIISILM